MNTTPLSLTARTISIGLGGGKEELCARTNGDGPSWPRSESPRAPFR